MNAIILTWDDIDYIYIVKSTSGYPLVFNGAPQAERWIDDHDSEVSTYTKIIEVCL